jgi:hypothetical protein
MRVTRSLMCVKTRGSTRDRSNGKCGAVVLRKRRHRGRCCCATRSRWRSHRKPKAPLRARPASTGASCLRRSRNRARRSATPRSGFAFMRIAIANPRPWFPTTQRRSRHGRPPRSASRTLHLVASQSRQSYVSGSATPTELGELTAPAANVQWSSRLVRHVDQKSSARPNFGGVYSSGGSNQSYRWLSASAKGTRRITFFTRSFRAFARA